MPRSGTSNGDRELRASAIARPITRISGSAIRNIFTLIQKPSTIAGSDSRAWNPSKKISRTRGHPGDSE